MQPSRVEGAEGALRAVARIAALAAATFALSAAPALAAEGDIEAVLVKDVLSGGSGSDPQSLVSVGGFVFFTANDGVTGKEVWRSDGTSAGTVRVTDINPGPADGINGSQELIVAGPNVFFRANDGSEQELWKIGPPYASATEIDVMEPGSSNAADHRGVLNGELYFDADGGTGDGTELWKSDGGPLGSGTQQVADIHPGGSSFPENFTSAGDVMFFRASDGNDGVDGTEVWRTDGTPGDAHELEVETADGVGSDPSEFAATADRLFFTATQAGGGEELWTADQDDPSPSPLEIVTGPGDPAINEVGTLGSNLIFDPDDGLVGSEPWRSNGGTVASGGTARIADINPGADPSYPEGFTALAGRSYFSAFDPAGGRELWRTDLGPLGAGGTERVADIYAGTDGSDPLLGAVSGGRLWFTATSAAIGRELWWTDGAVTRGADLTGSPGNSDPQFIVPGPGESVYFSANDASGVGRELWKATIEGPPAPPAKPGDPKKKKKCKKRKRPRGKGSGASASAKKKKCKRKRKRK